MIIEDVQITPVAIPAEGLKEEKSDIVCALIIEISTDCGLVGIGESPLLLEEENICVPMHTVIRNNLIGKDACDISKRIRDLSADLELHKLHLQAADRLIRGVESALWDILGKRVGKPLCDVWGGAYRQQIEFAGEVKWQSLPARTESVEAGARWISNNLSKSKRRNDRRCCCCCCRARWTTGCTC